MQISSTISENELPAEKSKEIFVVRNLRRAITSLCFICSSPFFTWVFTFS